MSLCVCVSVEHLLLKKSMFPVVEKRRAKRRRPWSSTKSRWQKQNCTTSLQEPNADQSAPQISIQSALVKGLYSYCHLLCQAYMLKRWGHEYWIVFTTTGSFHLTQKDVSVFWLFDLLNRNVPRATQRSTLMFNLAGAIQSILLWNHCKFEHNGDLCLQFYTDFTDLDQFTRLVTSTAYSGPLRVSTHWVIFKHHSVHIL